MKKSVTAILMTTLIVVSLMAPLLSTVQADDASWYTSVNGVLATDAYTLYPYEKSSVNVGFSKFGELIGLPAGVDPATATQADWVGLEYGGRDPFCPATVVPMSSWINGWYIDIQYTDPALSGSKRNRHLWAFAMFGDGFGFGGDWKWAANPGDEPGYGRKTNGTCVTDPLKILYDGPRKFIAMSVTHIYDKEGAATWQVVDLAITLIFNKVKKEVIILKDVKLKVPKMHIWGKLDVELSNREEYDLGPASSYDSYAHFYPQYGDTYYGPDWHMATNLLRERVEHITATGQTQFTLSPTGGAALAQDFIKVWINGVFQDPSTYTVSWTGKTITFSSPVGAPSPAPATDIEVHYKYVFKASYEWDTEYDIAQVISSDGDYVAWTAMWPPVSDYTVDGILRYLDPLTEVSEADCNSEPKQSPLIIGEWDFLMDHTDIPQFRCVEVKGITDNHDGEDEGMGWPYGNYIDSEVQYQLDEVFLPWDLWSAMEKEEYSWVKITTSPSPNGVNNITLTSGLNDAIWQDKATLVWSGYKLQTGDTGTATWVNAFANGPTYAAYSKNWALKLYARNDGDANDDYARVRITPTDFGMNGINQFEDLTEISFMYKEISGNTTYGPHMFVKLSNGTAGSWVNIQMYNNPVPSPTGWVKVDLSNIDTYTDQASADEAFWYDSDAWTKTSGPMAGVASGAGVAKHSFDFYRNKLANYYVTDIVVELGYNLGTDQQATYLIDDIDVGYLNRASGIRYERVYNMEENKLVPSDWDAYCTFSEKVIVGSTLIARAGYQKMDFATFTFDPYYTIDFVSGKIYFYTFDWTTFSYIPWTITAGTRIKVLYNTIEENDRGRYEWATVGRDSETVDSAGLGLVTAAFKNKDIEIGLTGADMDSATVANQMPWVMAKWGGTGNTWADYYKSGTDYRTALKDDWCSQWSVAASNMIGVGGPLANMLAYYGNDFTDAIYGLPDFAGTAYSGKVTGVPCWNRGWNGTMNAYASGTTVGAGFFAATAGYAVISTYKDINGTVMLLIWGHWGRDTYYATKWFHEEGIYQLQQAPRGITSIIVQIAYYMFDPTHPSFSIVEVLGTISETLWVHGTWPYYEYKGGIHDP